MWIEKIEAFAFHIKLNGQSALILARKELENKRHHVVSFQIQRRQLDTEYQNEWEHLLRRTELSAENSIHVHIRFQLSREITHILIESKYPTVWRQLNVTSWSLEVDWENFISKILRYKKEEAAARCGEFGSSISNWMTLHHISQSKETKIVALPIQK